MVGFNRRFAPLVERLQAELGRVDDLVLSMRVNAGPLPDDHWLHDPEDGGGRLLGEGCHFVDLLATSPARAARVGARGRGAAAWPADRVQRQLLGPHPLRERSRAPSSTPAAATRGCRRSGSRCSAAASRRCSTTSDVLTVHRGGKRREWKSSQDKGHRAEIRHFLAAAAGLVEPPAYDSYLSTSRLMLSLVESLRNGQGSDGP